MYTQPAEIFGAVWLFGRGFLTYLSGDVKLAYTQC